jgi:hypothetical protein
MGYTYIAAILTLDAWCLAESTLSVPISPVIEACRSCVCDVCKGGGALYKQMSSMPSVRAEEEEEEEEELDLDCEERKKK